MLCVGDVSEEAGSEDDKLLDSMALAKFLSKAATVTKTVHYTVSQKNVLTLKTV